LSRSRFALALLLPLLAAACGGSPAETPTASAPSPTPTPTPGPFDTGVLHEARIDVDPATFETLLDHYQDDTYYPANISLDGQSLANVGIRSRGEGSRSNVKPAIQVSFAKYQKGQTLFGLQGVALKNLVQDASMLREALALPVFSAMGIPTPRASFARVYVNGDYYGLYNVIEDVDDDPFLIDHFAEKSGNLFKYEYAFQWDFSFLGDDPARYVPAPFKPETHKDSPDASALVSMIDAVNHAPESGYAQALSTYLDPAEVATYVAVENAVAERDGLLGDQGLNNFYVYQHTGGDRFVVVPWDKNTSFTAASWPLYRGIDDDVLTSRLLADPAQRQAYLDATKRAVTSYVNSDWLGSRLDAFYAQVRDAALADPKKPFTNEQFEQSVGGLRGVIAARQADVMAQAR
jgi:spore coat protein CotH